jgi:hypothetical protein
MNRTSCDLSVILHRGTDGKDEEGQISRSLG